MRKLLSYIVLFIYVVLSLGVSVHFHYCQGKLKNVTLFTSSSCCPDEAAGSCGFHSSCCDDESLRIDSPSDYPGTAKLQLPNFDFIIAKLAIYPDFVQVGARSIHLQLPDSRGAPPDSKVPVYLKLCRITYYG